MSDPEIIKQPLIQNRQVPLSLYIYIVRDGVNNVVAVPQNVSLITAYTSEEAMFGIQRQVPNGKTVTLDLKGIIPMTQVLQMFNQTIDVSTQPENKPKYYKEVVEGMLKGIDSFIDHPEDKPVLEKALFKMLSLVNH